MTRTHSRLTANILSLLIVVAFGVAIYSFVSAHQRACDSRNVALNVLATMLSDAQAATDHRRDIPRATKVRSQRFIDKQLVKINDARC